MAPRTFIACVHLAPWALTLAQRRHPGVPVAVLSEARKVVHVSPEAALAGVEPGMRETAALSRCPDLHAEVVTAPAAQATWNELLEELYARYADRVEGRTPGAAFLTLTAPAARELAVALHAPIGLGTSLEGAQLAALRAKPGEVKEAAGAGQAELAFLALTSIDHLTVLGLSPAHLERLRFLGLRGLADLVKWSPAQREAFLGVDVGKKLNRFLRGERTTAVARYVPGQVIEARLSVDAPMHEPCELDAALAEVLPGLWTELRGRTAAYLHVRAETALGTLSATRKLKWPLDEEALQRLAALALTETEALDLGIDRLTVGFSGLAQPSRMVGLWAGLAELEVTRDVLGRFPDALVRVHWLDPFSYVTDAQYEWVDWLTGEVRATPMTPPRVTPTRAQRHDRAVKGVLAFFEGATP